MAVYCQRLSNRNSPKGNSIKKLWRQIQTSIKLCKSLIKDHVYYSKEKARVDRGRQGWSREASSHRTHYRAHLTTLLGDRCDTNRVSASTRCWRAHYTHMDTGFSSLRPSEGANKELWKRMICSHTLSTALCLQQGLQLSFSAGQ